MAPQRAKLPGEIKPGKIFTAEFAIADAADVASRLTVAVARAISFLTDGKMASPANNLAAGQGSLALAKFPAAALKRTG